MSSKHSGNDIVLSKFPLFLHTMPMNSPILLPLLPLPLLPSPEAPAMWRGDEKKPPSILRPVVGARAQVVVADLLQSPHVQRLATGDEDDDIKGSVD